MERDEDVIRLWNRNAPYWEKHRETIRGMFGPVTDALIEDAGIRSGHSVLDVATGSGEPALTIAGVVSPDGKVIGIDPISGMVEASTRAAQVQRLHNASFEVASADDLPFPDDHFDAVVSRFGVMFFPSPIDGVREMARVLKPDRTLALSVWGHRDDNPFHSVLSGVVDRYIPPDPVPPDSPDAFRFAARGTLLDVLNRAGLSAVKERTLRFDIEIPLSLDDYWEFRMDMSDKFRTKLSSLPDGQAAAIRRDVMKDLDAYSTGRGVAFPAEVLIVSGVRRRGL